MTDEMMNLRAMIEKSPIEGDWPYLWIGATYVKVRPNGRIVSVAVIVTFGVNSDGRREMLGKPSHLCAMIPPSAFRQSPADRPGLMPAISVNYTELHHFQGQDLTCLTHILRSWDPTIFGDLLITH